jgi:3-oxoacyl-[acyl-carrier-protein] synthase-3
MIRSVVRGFGASLPQRVMTNREMEEKVDTSDEWIVQRTGIRERTSRPRASSPRIAGAQRPRARPSPNAGLTRGRYRSDHAWRPRRPTTRFRPPRSPSRTGSACNHGAAFDLQAVCSGFVFALATADNYPRGPPSGRWSSARKPFRASSTGPTAAPACCSATAPARLCWRPRMAAGNDATDRGILTTHLRSDGATRKSSMSTAVRPRPARSVICAWRAARSSSMRSA